MIKGIAHIAFQVSNMDKSVEFYEDALGCTKKFVLYDDHGQPWIIYMQIAENQFIELFFAHRNMVTNPDTTSYQHLCIEVTNIHEVVKALEDKGIKIAKSVVLGLDHNYQCWIKDPDGNPIELMEYGFDSLQLKTNQ
ncbi:MAG: VOC family protein [Bacilli bacterium]|nr:VOC family protein [Bacilli bacterium]